MIRETIHVSDNFVFQEKVDEEIKKQKVQLQGQADNSMPYVSTKKVKVDPLANVKSTKMVVLEEGNKKHEIR